MKRRSNTIKGILSLALALMLVLSLSVTAFAANQVTIMPNGNTTTPTGENASDAALKTRFKAYQIFAGSLDEDYAGGVGSEDSNTGYKNPNANNLSNVTWGSSVTDIQGMLEALMADTTPLAKAGVTGTLKAPYTGASTLGDLFKAQLKDSMYWEGNGLKTTGVTADEWKQSAAAIAKVLDDFAPTTGDKNNAALAEAFAKAVKNSGKLGSAEAESEWNTDRWTIGDSTTGDHLAGGYYLIEDTYKESGKNASSSDFLMGVFGDSTIYVKSEGIVIEKSEITPNNKSDHATGETINYQLKAILPKNYGNYEKYYLKFNDTMQTGLTYTGGLTVYAMDTNGNKYTISKGANGYKATSEPTTAGGDLVIEIDDLKTVTLTPVDGAPTPATISAGWSICVEYTAELNENAKVTGANSNEFDLDFSNDPKNTGDPKTTTGKTPKEYVYVYTFGVDLFKFDGSTEKTPLEAGFAVTDANGKYAILAGPDGEGCYAVAGWATEDQVKTALGVTDLADADWETEVDGADLAGCLGEAFAESGTYCFAVKTDDEGKLKIKGLDANIEYKLKEVIVPEGYDELADIPVKFTATYFDEDDFDEETGAPNEGFPADVKVGMLKSLTVTYTVNGQSPEAPGKKIVVDGYWATEQGAKSNHPVDGTVVDSTAGQTDLLAHLNVPNFPASWLPGTGGMGTTLFYVAGSVLLIGAALYLIIAKKKSQKQ